MKKMSCIEVRQNADISQQTYAASAADARQSDHNYHSQCNNSEGCATPSQITVNGLYDSSMDPSLSDKGKQANMLDSASDVTCVLDPNPSTDNDIIVIYDNQSIVLDMSGNTTLPNTCIEDPDSFVSRQTFPKLHCMQ